MTMKQIAFPAWALVAWGLTVVLVSQLLGGTFEGRSCQSGCVWTLYWIVFALTAAGCATGVWWALTKDGAKPLPALIAIGAMIALLGIFLTTMAIGVFG